MPSAKDSHIKWDICVMWQVQHMCCIWQWESAAPFQPSKCFLFALVTVARRIKNNYNRCRLTISAIAILSKFRSYCTFSAPEWFRWKMSSCRKCTNLFLLRLHWIHILPEWKNVVCKFNYISHMISRCSQNATTFICTVVAVEHDLTYSKNYYLWNVIQRKWTLVRIRLSIYSHQSLKNFIFFFVEFNGVYWVRLCMRVCLFLLNSS